MNTSFDTLAQVLEGRARLTPGRVGFTFLNDGERDAVSLTYQELDARARAVAHQLTELKTTGKPVLVMHPPGLDFIAGLFGCFYAGAIAVPTYPPAGMRSRSASRLANMVADVEPMLALSTKTGVERTGLLAAREPGLEGLPRLATDTLPRAPDYQCTAVAADSPAIVQYTSGSTGSPRGVILSHANLLSNLAVIWAKVVLPVPELEPSLVSWAPPYHDMGLIGGILGPLFGEVPAVLMDPQHFLRRPMRWLEAISVHRVSISIAPNSALDLCVRSIRPGDCEGLDLSSWRVAINGAEPVRAETLDRFVDTFGPFGFRRRTFLPSYGLAESTLMATAGQADEEPSIETGADGRRHVSCGTPGAGHRVLIADPETGQPLPEGETGEICLAGPSVCGGYWGKPEQSAELFRNGFLRTGDLGFLNRGELYVTGRLKDLIIVAGRNFYPQDLEHAAELAHFALAPDSSAAFAVERDGAEQAVVACEVRRDMRRKIDAAEVSECVRRAIAGEFDLRLGAVALLNPGGVPRTNSGKPRRRACREAFEAGRLDAIPVPDAGDGGAPASPEQPAALVEQVRSTIASLRKIPAVWLDDERPIAALGVDSLMRVELLLTLEAVLERPLEASTVDPEITIPEIARRIERSGGTSAPQRGPLWPAGRAVPFTPPQRWFLRPSREDIAAFSTVLFLRTPVATDGHSLEKALHLTESHHDAMQLRFRRENGDWLQERVKPGSAVAFERVDVSAASAEEVAVERDRLIHELPRRVDPEHGPLVWAVWYDQGPSRPGLLFLCLHHLVFDGLSVAVFVGTLERLYRTLRRGEEPSGPPAGTSFVEWAMALDALAQSREVLAHLPYWREVCATVFRPRPTAKPAWHWTLARSLSPEAQARFDARFPTAQEQHDGLLAAFWQAWEEETGSEELFVELENNGRQAVAGCEAFRAVGWFVNRYPARLRADGPCGEAERLRLVREYLSDVPLHGASFEMLAWLHRDAAIRAEIECLPRPHTAFAFWGHLHDIHAPHTLFPVLRKYSINDALGADRDRASLELHVNRRGGLVAWQVFHDANIHSEDAARRIAARMEAAIEELCRENGRGPAA
jgi:acyl-CoA synthetase (AMP-forming)/AMP-acid ligase II/acyl carrier protein